MLHSGLPPEISVYPEFLGERYPHILLRMHYVAGSFADRRAAFANYVGLLNTLYVPLAQFLLPSVSNDQMVDSYVHMVRAILQRSGVHTRSDLHTL